MASPPRLTTRTNSTRSGARALLRPDRVGHGTKAAALVHRRVLAEFGLEDLTIALRQRRGGQPVGHEDDDDRTDDEERRVPERETQPERWKQSEKGSGVVFSFCHL